ncbi:hypothetical protein PsYK624_064470 [Phanerochaete sordida]|uniref:Tetratricopeptide SHNi-TPR domain-containing protein n=1 Tax=Phanerochaete sordida TaxID=48140 RepID=A0A9P3G6S1_9APHY|nr:hypothetical protein PsYK624_064470 [Phanerochaete sordida]
MSSEQPDTKPASTTATEQAATAPAAPSIEEQLELAKRAFALKKYEQAVDHYATALEQMTAQHGDDSPEIADVYFAYGKALLENAITQTSVLGKEQADEAPEPEKEASGSGAFLSFSGDAEEDEPVDLFGQAAKVEEDDDEEEEEEGDEGEPEDDFNAAWEVLDLARALFEKRQDESDEIKLKLADTYICLGDVSLETEKFDQAITDYEAGLAHKAELLPQSSRQIAEAHYKLSIVLDMSSGRLSDAIEHAEKALASVEARLAELRNAVGGQLKVEPLADAKGKGKGPAKGPRMLGDDAIQNMTQAQRASEIKELEGLKEDLALKVEELKTLPNEEGLSAPALAAKALDTELNAGAAAPVPAAPAQVNDLTGMVKKKKKPAVQTAEEAAAPAADANGSAKRKAEDEAQASPSEKKARLEETDAPAS